MKKLKDMTKEELNAYKYSKLKERLNKNQLLITNLTPELMEILRAYLASNKGTK